tara:strand:+ start:440 stop:808 length:369 start_codon:yes stop_codon:yes gene_type:complete
MKDTYYLFRSDKPAKKFVMVMPSHKHIHHFGSSAHRDFTLLNDKSSRFYEADPAKRNQVKENYHKRHSKEKGGRHTASSMSKIILWSAPTLRKGIQNYEKKFGVKVVFNPTKLTDALKKKLI